MVVDWAKLELVFQKNYDDVLYQDETNVISMATYRIERMEDYPDVPHNWNGEGSWYARKQYMKDYQAKIHRMRHNQKVSQDYKPKGPPNDK